MPTRPPLIRAAGGLVHRDQDGNILIAVVHRARYGDWSLPKGKSHTGPKHSSEAAAPESALTAAVREVHEETGSLVAVQSRLGVVAYDTAIGPKLVEYFVMRHIDGQFAQSEDLRPLSGRGQRQAAALGPLLAAMAPSRILSAPPLRCSDTVAPLAARLGLVTQNAPWAGDHAFEADPAATTHELRKLVAEGGSSVVCSQGITIPAALQSIAGPTADYATAKGAFWVLSFAGEDLITIDRHTAP
jgi:phosphohistidine phosphatase SixA